MVIVFHVTWLVNSATHIWGYRNYETSDDSRNLWWVGLLAFGEGWHNNHHAFQRMAKHGHRWWEVDVTYWAILAMEKLGIAWNVVHHPTGAGRRAAGQHSHARR
jgi:stearoyl-CoA desaturase (delta-9 desaturase)